MIYSLLFLLFFPGSFYQEKILIIGDSEAGVTSHYLDSVQTLNETVESKYKVGSQIQYWSDGGKFYEALKSRPQFDTIIIFLGTNNFTNRTLPNLQPILALAERRPKCIWVGPPKVHGRKWLFNSLLKNYIEANSTCRYVDSENIDIALSDGIHPNKKGAIKWLQEIWKIRNQ